ncbi:calcium-binding protein [Histoplasma capsulatum var. duboisii H88]|uniref:Calcium-binding protein n=1 Tax=Ajellomyces capsulatus (strain H88) TaxID=544711 RepID=A0A8A1LE82_AJEC8|nr:calcium-binding protein [Histoplasma capsulatum var. duboisii H88]
MKLRYLTPRLFGPQGSRASEWTRRNSPHASSRHWQHLISGRRVINISSFTLRNGCLPLNIQSARENPAETTSSIKHSKNLRSFPEQPLRHSKCFSPRLSLLLSSSSVLPQLPRVASCLRMLLSVISPLLATPSISTMKLSRYSRSFLPRRIATGPPVSAHFLHHPPPALLLLESLAWIFLWTSLALLLQPLAPLRHARAACGKGGACSTH